MKETKFNLAKRAAYNAVSEAHRFTGEQYFGDAFHAPIYTIGGLAEEILELYENEYNDQPATLSTFENIAYELI